MKMSKVNIFRNISTLLAYRAPASDPGGDEKERERIKTNLTFNKLRIADLLQMMIKNNVEIKLIECI